MQANPPPSEKVKKERSIFSTDSSTDSEDHSVVTVAPPPPKVVQKLPLSNEANRVEKKVTQNTATRSSKLFASDSDDDELVKTVLYNNHSNNFINKNDFV